MEKFIITNRKGQKIVVLLEKNAGGRGLAFVMHGLSGFKEQPHIAAFAQAFKNKGFTVVRFDTTNTFGESDGHYEAATTTNYFEDLEDVIAWSKKQDWYQEPFWLAGHSLGGISVALYAEKFPGKVRGLAPISTVVSGKLSIETPKYKETIEDWRKTGWREEKSASTGRIKRLPWSHIEDRLKYDLIPDAAKLTMPVLLMVGDRDDSTPPEHQQMLFEKLPGPKEIHIIKGARHDFVTAQELKTVAEIIENWIAKYL